MKKMSSSYKKLELESLNGDPLSSKIIGRISMKKILT